MCFRLSTCRPKARQLQAAMSLLAFEKVKRRYRVGNAPRQPAPSVAHTPDCRRKPHSCKRRSIVSYDNAAAALHAAECGLLPATSLSTGGAGLLFNSAPIRTSRRRPSGSAASPTAIHYAATACFTLTRLPRFVAGPGCSPISFFFFAFHSDGVHSRPPAPRPCRIAEKLRNRSRLRRAR